MNYEHMSDEELLVRIREQDTDAMDYLMDKYRNLVRKETREVFMIGADTEDLMQEGMIGLFKAIRDYHDDKNCSFFTFASLCVRRQIYSAITNSNRKKHIPLNTYISFYSEEQDGKKSVSELLMAEEESNPEQYLLIRERIDGLMKRMDTELSAYEKRVLDCYLDGMSYEMIAENLGKPEKSIDNAIQRIRKKLAAE